LLGSKFALLIGVSLIVLGGAAYFLEQQPFVDCPAFMGLLVGQMSQDVLERCHVQGTVQITGSVIFISGVFFAIYGGVTRYSS